MNGFDLSIEDVCEQTGLSRSYVDRCFMAMPVLDEYRRSAPDQNKYLYSSNAIAVFLQIADLRQQGFKRHEIRERLQAAGLGSREGSIETSDEVPREAPKSPPRSPRRGEQQEAAGAEAFQMIQQLTTQLIQEKDHVIEEKQRRIQNLKNKILFLTDGRPLEKVKEEREAEAKRMRELERQQAEELQTLAEYREELEDLKQGREQERQRRLSVATSRSKILNELERTRWYEPARRRQLLDKLKQLEQHEVEGSSPA